MRDYVIYTDSACDVSRGILKQWGVYSYPLTFRFSDDNKEYSDYDMEIGEFYARMRAGGVAKTAAINSETFYVEFEKVVKEGKDVLYLGFSSGLSTTYNSARFAAEQLSNEYPEAKIIAVDTLAASAGQGLLVRLVADKKENGATIEEAASYAKEIALSVCHWFTVDDLVYLKRGGRISSAAAFFGNVIGIKPVLHVDDAGHLVNVAKVRGRKSSVAALAQKYEETAIDKSSGKVFISHADCIKEAEELAQILKAKHGVEVELITNVGAVIGAHSGPGTLALFFIGNKR